MKKLLKALNDVVASAPRRLMDSLYQALGNKRYLHDVEMILAKMELTADEERTLLLLANDIANLKNEASNNKNKFGRF